MRKKLVTSAIAILVLGSVAIPASADAHGSHTRRVRMQDNCDPATFDAAFGPGTCLDNHGHDNVTLPEFFAALNPVDFGHEDWNFKPSELDLDSGDSIKVVVRGGEYHTFTEVPKFEPGCIGVINDLLGLTGVPSVFDCATLFTTPSGVHPGDSITVSGLSDGTHLFMCEIHPWMRSVVTVGEDDDD